MMSLKRKAQYNRAEAVWRADFRDLETLPDTKPVRTGFLINFASISVLFALITLLVYNEYSLRLSRVASKETEIDVRAQTDANRKLLFRGGEFRKLSRQAEEVVGFKRVPVNLADLLKSFAVKVPEQMTIFLLIFDQLPDAEADGLGVLSISGTILPETPSGPSLLLEQFQDEVAALPEFGELRVRSDIEEFGRNNSTGNFDFTMRFDLSAVQEDAVP